MKDYASMSDQQINKLVAAADGMDSGAHYMGDVVVLRDNRWVSFDPCNNPADAWAIIVENKISLNYMLSESAWCAHADGLMTDGCWSWDISPEHYHDHANPLRAAMVVFLMMKEGE